MSTEVLRRHGALAPAQWHKPGLAAGRYLAWNLIPPSKRITSAFR